MLLNVRILDAAKPGAKLSEPAPRGAGRLVFRKRSVGSPGEFFYRTRTGGRDRMTNLGVYGEISLAEARKRVALLSSDPTAASAEGTLGDLLAAYVAHLDEAGRKSASDVRRMFRRAIPDADALRLRRANEIKPGDIAAIVAKRINAGATTEANRLRSYLSAAFAHGARVDFDPRRVAQTEVRFGLTANPVSVVARVREFEKTRDRVLSWDELGELWRQLDHDPLPVRLTLRFAIASGGQRLQQLLRATWEDVDGDVLRLIDPKGRGGARPHAVAIGPLAAEQLKAARKEKWAVPFPTHKYALADAISRIKGVMGGEAFDWRDVRRTVETRLADLGVSRDTLAHLLSHGRTGVQAKHYDRAERIEEKLAALAVWEHHLRAAIEKRKPSGAVVPMRRRKA